MSEHPSWRELLGQIASTPAERERLAFETGVRSITLNRWIMGESAPRPPNLRRLVQAIPLQYRTIFQKLVEEEEDVDFTLDLIPVGSPDDLSSQFLMQVLDTRATIPETLRFWTICRLVLQHALRNLDPQRQGLAITVVRCMPPSKGGKVRSLREDFRLGTPPWDGDLETSGMFLGVESLAGYAVVSFFPRAIQNLEGTTLYPAHQMEHEVSAIASPLLYANRVAGCLLLSSTQRDYFLPAGRLALIHGYTQLITLAFDTNEFYPLTALDLHMMPPLHVQQAYFSSFRQRVYSIMNKAFNEKRLMTSTQAELLAWQEIEEELIRETRSPEQTSEE